LTFDQKIQVAIAVGTCFAAVATSAAVIYSLIQTRRATRSKLKFIVILTRADGKPNLYGDATALVPALRIQVANHGQRLVYLTYVGWKTGRLFARKKMSQNITSGWPLPCKVEPAEYATFWITPDDWDDWLKDFCTNLLAPPRFWFKPYIRILARTSLGEDITAKLSKEVFTELTRYSSKSNAG
jgi:hypothetical protein